jgi:exosortase family protein XrtF
MIPSKNEPSYRILVDGSPVVRIVEGCNAVSVMILFMAFVVAFTGKLKTTIWFIIAGILLIHVLNVSRISTLIVGLIKYPQYGEILHDIVFPLIIYGVTFVLWVIWVTKFSNYAK